MSAPATWLNEYPHERTEFSDASYAAIGRALAYATAFEDACRGLSRLLHIGERLPEVLKSVPDLDAAFAKIVQKEWDDRLGQHVKRILDYHEFPSNVGEMIKQAKAARNEIAHEIALGTLDRPLPSIETDNFRTELLSRLAQLVRAIANGFIIVELASLSHSREPLPTRSFLSSYPDRIVEWVTEP
jgi:hypothetical protein